MTIEQYLHALLFERGIFDKDIDTIMASFKAKPVNADTMSGRLDELENDYPAEFLNILSANLFMETLSWIDENKPKAWYRGNFVIGGQ